MDRQSPRDDSDVRPAVPRLSVIVPVRNDPRRLLKCLQAIAGSHFKDYELIVVDDGSTDDTAAIAESTGARVIRLPRCSGPAAARNAAADVARGAILMFVDADVCVHPQTLGIAVAALEDPAVDAVFGSYDLEPAEKNLLSQYKNLAHRYYHQASPSQVNTFWSGCGAIRADVFRRFRFDAAQFPRPSIEDIEMGVRMSAAGRRIVIDKGMVATHLKRWSLRGIVKSDLFDRAIPWTRVMHRNRLASDLNLSIGQRVAALLTALSAAIFLVACWFKPWLAVVPLVAVATVGLADWFSHRRPAAATLRRLMGLLLIGSVVAVVWYARWWAVAVIVPLLIVTLINAPFYRFFLRHRGPLFTAAVMPMQVGYYLYSLLGFGIGTAAHTRDTWPQRLDAFHNRVKLYVTVAAMLYVIAWALVLLRAQVKHTMVNFVVSDAVGMYIYLPSLVIDHDLNFDNQIDGRVPRGEEPDFQRELKHNRYQTGIALTLLPPFLVAHVLSLATHAITESPLVAPDGYTLIYQALIVAWAMAVGVGGLVAADRVIVERFDIPGRFAAAAVLLTWLGTNYVWYFTREPLLMHMIGASWISLCIYLVHRIESSTRTQPLNLWQIALLAFATSMALDCRATNVVIFPMYLYLLIVLIKRRMLTRLAMALPLIIPALFPLAIQFFMARAMMVQEAADAVHALGYDAKERFYWDHPALFRTLFSSRHGLFFSAPALLLSVWGIGHNIRQRRDGLLVCLAVTLVILWYINSSWYAWWFGPSVGNRAFVEMAGIFVIGFGLGFHWLSQQSLSARRVLLTLLCLAVAMNYFVVAAKMFDLVGENSSLIPWEDRVLPERI